MMGNPPVGKSTETTAIHLPRSELAFKPLVDLLQVRQFLQFLPSCNSGKYLWYISGISLVNLFYLNLRSMGI